MWRLAGRWARCARYGAMSLIGRFNPHEFPYGTFAVNIFGSFLMGVWIATMAALLPPRAKDLHLLIAVGVLGGFTTFSTFSLDTFLLFERGLWAQAALYIGRLGRAFGAGADGGHVGYADYSADEFNRTYRC